MAGIYIHIPFCKQACHYCNFYFHTSQKLLPQLFKALKKELILQKDYLKQEKITSIYLGGGTPSLLQVQKIAEILDTIYKQYVVTKKVEITLEANPDDLSQPYVKELYQVGINRLSIGIQSFQDDILRYLNRAHNAFQAHQSIQYALKAGFKQMSLDLIYGIPHQTINFFQKDLESIIRYKISHLSTYCLTIEPHTVFHNWSKKNKLQPVKEKQIVLFFNALHSLEKNGYEHYEISNFCKPNAYAHHNSSYWKKHSYLGIGPSTHSYNQKTRQYNIANIQKYIQAIEKDTIPASIEVLTKPQHINEYIMVSLRTQWGCNLSYLNQLYQHDVKTLHRKYLEQLIQAEYITLKEATLYLTKKGMLLADEITLQLMTE